MTSTVISGIIESVVASELGSDTVENYAPAIAKVSEALTEKAYDATDELISIAVNQLGVSEDDARHYITQSGLPVRPLPEPEPVVEEEIPAAVEVEELSDTDRIRLLEEGQRKQGESLGKLLELADKIGTHLGLND